MRHAILVTPCLLLACRGAAPETPETPRAACLQAEGSQAVSGRAWQDEGGRATVEVAGEPCARTFTLATTAELRDGRPDNPRTIREEPGQSSLSTGNDLFDALYAMTITEARLASVSEIKDSAFSEGNAIDCECFETGRLWTYVWTRDTAYAADLGLAGFDPARARRSLEFKLSERRGGGDLQVVQDTGSGGSYPISTDRVAWALGARAVLAHLEGSEREAFAARTLEALANTIEHDRAVAFDPIDGLYRGETSFLDWREQSYAPWTARDTVHIGMSKALSTNVAHLVAVELAARLGGERGDERAARWQQWGRDLRRAIAERFWLPPDRMFASFTSTGFGEEPVRRFDLLGISLAILEGVASPQQARDAIAAYPMLPPGPPVLAPQQPEVPTYHNRGVWPFVTAYGLRAARAAGNEAAVTDGALSMVRGAALNLSNMENFDALTGSPMAPAVNSQRQLWSVAGYLSMVHDVLFGIEVTAEGIRFQPFVPGALRERLFAGTRSIVLRDYRWRGRRLDVVLRFPEGGGDAGVYRAAAVRVEGREVGDGFLEAAELPARGRVEVDLAWAPAEPSRVNRIGNVEDREAIFGPPPPTLEIDGAELAIGFDDALRAAVTFDVYRDGARWKGGVPGTTETLSDPDAGDGRTHCYSVEAVYRSSGNPSMRSAPSCRHEDRIEVIEAEALSLPEGWLREGETATAPSFTARASGEHFVRLRAANGAGPINTGVTCGVVHVSLVEEASGRPVASGYLAVPHGGKDAWDRFLPSSLVRARLEKGKRYRIALDTADRRAVNMSAFAHFERYTGGAGGAGGAMNRIRIESIEILW